MIIELKSKTGGKRVKCYAVQFDGIYTGGFTTKADAEKTDKPGGYFGRVLCDGLYSTAHYIWSKRHGTRLPNKREREIMAEAERLKKQFNG